MGTCCACDVDTEEKWADRLWDHAEEPLGAVAVTAGAYVSTTNATLGSGLIGLGVYILGSSSSSGPSVQDLLNTTVIELQGNDMFCPPEPLASYIAAAWNGVLIKARFGAIAEGWIRVFSCDGCCFYTDAEQWLPLRHPDIQPRDTREVGLAISMTDSVITGKIGVAAGPGAATYDARDALLPILLGRSYRPGFIELDIWRNELVYGHLWLNTNFRLVPPEGPLIDAGLFIYDETSRFSGDAEVTAQGAKPVTAAVERSPHGILKALPKIEFAESWTKHGFTAGFETSFVDGTFEAHGRVAVNYPVSAPRISGSVDVLITSHDRAWAAARVHDPAPLISGGIEPLNQGTGEAALVAWGLLDFILSPGSPEVPPKAKTSPLLAHARFLVDPEGHLTAHGILRMPDQYVLIPQYDIAAWAIEDDWKIAGANIWYGVTGELRIIAGLIAQAGIGPLQLRDLVASGTYSTRPGTATQLSLEGSLNASAAAKLTAYIGLEAALELGIDLGWFDIGVDVTTLSARLEGSVEVRAYVDARPKIEVTKPASGDPIDNGWRYRIAGAIEAAGEAVVSLKAGLNWDLFGKLNPRLNADITNYKLGQATILVNFDHTFGSGTLPKFHVGAPTFDPKKFATNLGTGRTPAPRGRKVDGLYTDKIAGRRAEVNEVDDPVEPVPPRDFELTTGFDVMTDHVVHHDLVLEIRPGGSRIILYSLPGWVVDKLRAAIRRVDAARSVPGITDEARDLYYEQIKDLEELRDDALAVEHQANVYQVSLEHLHDSDLPGLRVLAARLAEYAVRYGDEDIEGVSRLLTAPIRELPTDPSTPHRYTWLGAERIGTTETFRGNFGDPAWNWDGFPDYPVLRHPVNDWEDYANDSPTVARPGPVPYEYGGNTKGWDATPWRGHLGRLLDAKTRTGLTEDQGKAEILDEFTAQGYPGLDWDDAYLEGKIGKRWQGHHVHEFSWGGPHDESNIQFLIHAHHHPASTWWNQRRDEIKRGLKIDPTPSATP
jgi:hypothetical protein